LRRPGWRQCPGLCADARWRGPEKRASASLVILWLWLGTPVLAVPALLDGQAPRLAGAGAFGRVLHGNPERAAERDRIAFAVCLGSRVGASVLEAGAILAGRPRRASLQRRFGQDELLDGWEEYVGRRL